MNFDFSAEQKAFGEQLRRMLARTAPLAESRRVMEGRAPYSVDAWRGLAHVGFQGTSIEPAYGGAGLGPLELCVAAEQIGFALAPVPTLSSVYIFTEAIRLYGTAQQRKRWLPRLTDGSLIGSWAGSGRFTDAASRGGSTGTRCERSRLYGREIAVLDGMAADIVVVPARHTDGGLRLMICELDARSVTRHPMSCVDPARPMAQLDFDGAEAEPLGDAGDQAWRALHEGAAILLAFEHIGAADRALMMARDFALERKAFGRAIGAYQAIKHKLAAVYARNQMARSHAYYGAWALCTGAEERRLAAAGARVSASAAFTFAAQENLHTHGGMGVTWDSDCHLFYRRARLGALVLGSAPEWKRVILRELDAAPTAQDGGI